MSLAFFLYLIDVLNNVDDICEVIFIPYFLGFSMVLISTFLTTGGFYDDFPEGVKDTINSFKKHIWIPIIALLISIIIPTQNTMYMMLGASYLQTSNLPAKVSEALDLKLDAVIADLKKNNSEDKK